MPSLSIDLDGNRVSTIDLTPMEVVDVSVHGSLDQDPKAVLDAMGGNYTEGGCGHLIWITETSLLPGEVLTVTLQEASSISDRGRSMGEIFPDEEPCTLTDFSINDEMAAELRARPQLHEQFYVQAATSNCRAVAVKSDDRNTRFTFRVLWDFTRPSEARVHLTTNCLDDVIARKVGLKHLEATLSFGNFASFSLAS